MAVAAAAANARREVAARREREAEEREAREAESARVNDELRAEMENLTARRGADASPDGKPPVASMGDLIKGLKLQKQLEELNPLSLGEKKDPDGLDKLLADPPSTEVVGPSGWVYHDRAFFCLRPADMPRRAAIFFVEWRWFDPIILTTILCNCSSMAWESPLDPPGTPKTAFIDVLEVVYLYIFTVELLSKVLAYGLVGHTHSYLRDAWCQLDFVVVTLAWIPIIFPSFGNYSVIRSIRALRPLRALKRVPGMPQLMAAIMAAMPKLGNVVGLCGFIFLVFGIVGMELFKGALHYRCTTHPGFRETGGHPRQLLEASPFPEWSPLASAGDGGGAFLGSNGSGGGDGAGAGGAAGGRCTPRRTWRGKRSATAAAPVRSPRACLAASSRAAAATAARATGSPPTTLASLACRRRTPAARSSAGRAGAPTSTPTRTLS